MYVPYQTGPLKFPSIIIIIIIYRPSLYITRHDVALKTSKNAIFGRQSRFIYDLPMTTLNWLVHPYLSAYRMLSTTTVSLSCSASYSVFIVYKECLATPQ